MGDYKDFLERKAQLGGNHGFSPVDNKYIKPVLLPDWIFDFKQCNKIYIYGLIDPFTEELRYIGKSIQPKQRLANQCNEHASTYRCHWIQSILSKGKRPKQVIIEVIAESGNWQEREKYWIAKYRAEGYKLVNSTDGGDGVVNLPPESKARIINAWIGRKHKPETLLKLSRARKGKKHTEEHKAKMSCIMSGREITWADKLSKAIKKFTPEQVLEIITRTNGKEKVKDIAKEFGVHRTTISNIRKGYYGYDEIYRQAVLNLEAAAKGVKESEMIELALED